MTIAEQVAHHLTYITGDTWIGKHRDDNPEGSWYVKRERDGMKLNAYSGLYGGQSARTPWEISLDMWVGDTRNSKNFAGDRLRYFSNKEQSESAGMSWANVAGKRAGGGIKVSHDKTPEQIAKDIVRRSLPMTSPAWAAIKASLAETERYQNAARTLADELATLAGVTATHSEGGDHTINARELTGGKGYGTVTVYEDSVSIELRSIRTKRARSSPCWVG